MITPSDSPRRRPSDHVVVETPDGPVIGEVVHADDEWPLAYFRSIPYAAPATGRWRWQAPRPVEPWTEPLDVRAMGRVSPQPYGTGYTGFGRQPPQGTDCQTVQVTTPCVPHEGLLPVLVYLHGGAFTSGGGDELDWSTLARRGPVVAVSFNYRLGALGWMHFDEYATAEQPIDHHLGLRDMMAALAWVRRSIQAFGGDPDNVTVLGQSAGAIALTALLASPAAEGLFARAILQSPAPSIIPDLGRAHGWAHEFLEMLGLDPTDCSAVSHGLARVPDRDLVRTLNRLNRRGLQRDPGVMPLIPAHGNELLPEPPYDMLRQGRGLPVPILAGTNRDEATLFAYFGALSRPARATWNQMRTAEQRFATSEDSSLSARDRWRRSLRFGTEAAFWSPTVQLAAGHSRIAPVWMYHYDYATPLLQTAGMGATHAIELLHVTGEDSPFTRASTAVGGRADFDRLTATLQHAWLGFIRDGDPGPQWPRYEPPSRWTRHFGRLDRLVADPHAEQRRAWEDLDLQL